MRSNAEEIRGAFPSGVQPGAVLKNGESAEESGRVIEDAADSEYFFVPKLDDAIALREDAEHLDMAGIATHFGRVSADDLAAIEADDEISPTVVQKNRFDTAVGKTRDGGPGEDAL